MKHADLTTKARRIKLVLTDCDGVLTDGGVYYGESGEVLKRFNIRDGMGVERLRAVGVDTGIITGERSPSVQKRADKLKITELHLGIKDKATLLGEIVARTGFATDQIAFIGDDTNDVEILGLVGLAACPGDATVFAREAADYRCRARGGHGAFRELAELIISCQGDQKPDDEGPE